MSSIFQRIRKARLAPDNKLNPPAPEQKTPDPITPIPETVIEYPCAHCGESGATHRFTNGDLYLKRLPYSYLCDVCWQEREAKRTRHNIANHNTVLEKAVSAVEEIS